jgi:hypothetical protein
MAHLMKRLTPRSTFLRRCLIVTADGPLVPLLPRARCLSAHGPLDSSPRIINEYGKGPRDRSPQHDTGKGPRDRLSGLYTHARGDAR